MQIIVDDREPRTRATHRDREVAALHVQEAVGRGQLTLDEATDRLGLAYAARYREEVDRLVADLPSERVEPIWAPGWSVVFTMFRLQLREAAQEAARRSRLAGMAVRHPRISAAILLVLLVGMGVLAHVLFGHDHHWHSDRFGTDLYAPGQ